MLISAAVSEGLLAAHDQGVIHRDLKPENILIPRSSDPSGVAKIIDFGIARMIDAPRITTTQHVRGTPQYISPEQAMGGPGDGRTDIYSLGVLMYEMISGALPFTGRDPESLLRKHIQQRPESLRALKPAAKLSPALESLIMACLEKSPRSRPADMGEVLSILATL